jgi:hypothetical protein
MLKVSNNTFSKTGLLLAQEHSLTFLSMQENP